MAISDIINKIKGMVKREPEEDYIPRQVVDRKLDSLERQRQTQLNELRKEQLVKEIALHQKQRASELLWGFKDKKEKQRLRTILDGQALKLKKRKEVSILNQKNILRKSPNKKIKSLLDVRYKL